MTWRGWTGAMLAVLAAGCAGARGTGGSGPVARTAMSAPAANAPGPGGGLYLDSALGFQIGRPSESWQMETTGEATAEGMSIPVVMRHRESGAQVVLQVIPAVATPTEMAERLTAGLRSYPDFSAGEPEPVALREGAVGFAFEMGGQIRGRVVVEDGGQGQVFMMLAAWPKAADPSIARAVDEIFSSLRPIPRM